MKKGKQTRLRSEYRREDLGGGIRGKHLKAYRAGTNLVLLERHVAAAFPTDQAVNNALNSLIKVAQQAVSPPKRDRHIRRPRSRVASI